MGKIFRKILSSISAVTLITAAILGTFSVSAASYQLSSFPGYEGYIELDSKGMLWPYWECEEYILLFNEESEIITTLIPLYNELKFVLNENLNYDDAKKRVLQIIDECFPVNNINASEEEKLKQHDYPYASISTLEKNGKVAYCVRLAGGIKSSDDERLKEAYKSSYSLMNKLNEENLISKFYDFGNVYFKEMIHTIGYKYMADTDAQAVRDFIAKKGWDCQLVDKETQFYSYALNFSEETTFLERFSMAADIYEATGAYPCKVDIPSLAEEYLGKNSLETIQATEPTINFGTPTIMGDLNLDNESGLSDIVALTKYTASAELFPINDPTALANADVNQDKSINSIDVNMLVEKALGHYENAVS